MRMCICRCVQKKKKVEGGGGGGGGGESGVVYLRRMPRQYIGVAIPTHMLWLSIPPRPPER